MADISKRLEKAEKYLQRSKPEPALEEYLGILDEEPRNIQVLQAAADLCLLLDRRYAPYSKWLGSAFARLEAAGDVGPPLGRILDARDDPSRERELASAYEAAARRFNALGLTEPVEPTVRPFFDRPFLVLGAGRYVEACLARVRDPWLRSLPLVGAIDQFADSSEVVDPGVARRFRAVFGPS